jgi:hypothetical protein
MSQFQEMLAGEVGTSNIIDLGKMEVFAASCTGPLYPW